MSKKKEDKIEEPNEDKEHNAFDDEWYCANLQDKEIEHLPEDTLYCSERKKEKDEDDEEDYSDGENWE